jgi:transcription elongation factor Elf1
MSGTPPRVYKRLTYLGRFMSKKMSSNSQYYEELSLPIDPNFQSQLGDEYKLAELGSLSELLDRLANYDRPDEPINTATAMIAMNHFLDKIFNCTFCSLESAFRTMPQDKSIGFGAKECGVYSRKDPAMYEYLLDYYNRSVEGPVHVIITASQKDEIRPSTKTPRLFTSYPPEHTFLATIVFNDFLQQFIALHFTTGSSCSALGDSMQLGAGVIYKEELQKLPYLYCTDTKAQDSSVSPDFIALFYTMVKSKFVLSVEEEALYEAVVFNTINKLLNVNGHAYLVSRGLGSGDYFTSVINVIWRLYMVLDNYHYPLDFFFRDNKPVINGDDLMMTSKYDDLNLNSRHATIEWLNRPITWEEADFCSITFVPYICHDPKKVLAVLHKRIPKRFMLLPKYQMQRLGGILRVLSNREVYDEVIHMMKVLAQEKSLWKEYYDLFITYEQLYMTYNTTFKLGR